MISKDDIWVYPFFEEQPGIRMQRCQLLTRILNCLIRVILFGVMAAALVPQRPVLAGGMTVDTLVDEQDGSCSDGDCSLRDAVQLAGAGTEIQITAEGTISLNSTLAIPESLSLKGPGKDRLTINGNGHQAFLIQGGPTTISGLTLMLGRAARGGGIYLSAGTMLTLADCDVRANVASQAGGGLYADTDSKLVIRNSTIRNNRASQKGGGVYAASAATLTLTDVTFSQNAVTSLMGQGGGLYADSSALSVTNSAIQGNLAAQIQGLGGGMYIHQGTIAIARTVWVGNQAGAQGGALFAEGSTGRLVNVTLSENKSPEGAGMAVSGGKINVINSILWSHSTGGTGAQVEAQASNPLDIRISIVQGGGPGANILDQDPMFLRVPTPGSDSAWGTSDDDYGDLMLRPHSPGVGAGELSSCAPLPSGASQPGCDLGALVYANHSPTEIRLSGTQVSEHSEKGTRVGSFSTVDADSGETFTYRLVSGPGGQDNASFSLEGDQLLTAGSFDYEKRGRYSIRVQSQDWRGASIEQQFNISISNISSDEQVDELPSTGFAPQQVTSLPIQPVGLSYTPLASLELEIPQLGIQTEITGIPLTDGAWDVTWLSNGVGYLEGTAFPTHAGNSVLSAHSILANGLPGPFYHLDELSWGDEVIVHAWGQRYIYEVRDVREVRPSDVSILHHEERPWLTLITCHGFDEESGAYRWRTVARAVLMRVEAEDK